MQDAANDYHAEAARWLDALAAALADHDAAGAGELFLDDAYWRDRLALTWNVETLEGRAAIVAMLDSVLAHVEPVRFTLPGQTAPALLPGRADVEAWFAFDTAAGRGRGHLRLRGGKCYTLLTVLTELKGYEERSGRSRAPGVSQQAARGGRQTWLERRQREQRELGHSTDPYCVIIGGGQGGIALGARLRRLDVPTIIVESNPRAGDSWRNRYRSLVLHDPVWFDHLPYLPFPDDWPVFTPKDKLGDWLEMYSRVMELNYWGDTRCVAACYDDETAEWRVGVERGGEQLTLKPRQLVFATGVYGPAYTPQIRGAATFAGEQFHASRYHDGRHYAGRRCAVIGAASSAHDICVDLWEAGAEVTMVQRSPTTVVRAATLLELGFKLYSEQALEDGIDTDTADLLIASLPFRLLPDNHIPLYQEIRRRDADFYARLERAGFLLDFGADDSGLMMKALRTGSGFYIDVGASDLIADGEIAVKAGVAVSAINQRGLCFDDGSELPVDVIIYATGYQSMHERVAEIISRAVADRVGPCWGLGSGVRGDPGPWRRELRNMWKPTAQPGLWFHGGNLAMSRHYSRYLALQLKARMEGLATPVYQVD